MLVKISKAASGTLRSNIHFAKKFWEKEDLENKAFGFGKLDDNVYLFKWNNDEHELATILKRSNKTNNAKGKSQFFTGGVLLEMLEDVGLYNSPKASDINVNSPFTQPLDLEDVTSEMENLPEDLEKVFKVVSGTFVTNSDNEDDINKFDLDDEDENDPLDFDENEF